MSRKLFKKSLISLAVASTIGLSGCLDQAGGDAQNTKAQLSGVASKGIIVDGVVTAYPIEGGAVNKNKVLGTAITDGKGKYSIDIDGYNGPVAVIVSPSTEKQSKVKCDVPTGCSSSNGTVAFGDSMDLNYEMEAIVPKVASGSSVSASITPLTHMAASFAKSGNLDEAAIAKANDQVAALLGVDDILEVEPVDVTDPAAIEASDTAQVKYGYLAASIAKVANDDANGDVGSALESLATSFADGQLTSNETEDSATNISLAEITTAAKEIIAAEEEVSGSTSLIGALAEIEVTDKDATDPTKADQETTVEVVAETNNVATAKTIVKELRTWAGKMTEQMEAGANNLIPTLETNMKAAGTDFEPLLMASGMAVMGMAEAFMQEQKVATETGTYALTDVLPGDMTCDINNSCTETPANATGDVVVSGNIITITDATINDQSVNLKITMPTSASGDSFMVSINEALVSNANAKLSIGASSATLTLNQAVTDIYNADPVVDKLVFNLDASLGHLANANIDTDKVNFSGKVGATLHVLRKEWANGEVAETVNPDDITLEGSFSVGNNTLTATLTGNMANADTFHQAEPKYLPGMTYADFGSYVFSTDLNTLTITWPKKVTTFSWDPATHHVTKTQVWDDGYTESEVLSTEVYNANTDSYEMVTITPPSLDTFLANNEKLSGTCNC
ncbi:MAG: hypothetical protein R3240_05905, partial [Gammaproteobacteria bacterium]|nr:hypothetical protein [Gammaproteobacteria bacterium]